MEPRNLRAPRVLPLLGALWWVAGCDPNGAGGDADLPEREQWACQPRMEVAVAPDEVVGGKVTAAEVVELVQGTFKGAVTWAIVPPEVRPEFQVSSSVDGTTAALTVAVAPKISTARFVEYEPKLVKEGASGSEQVLTCGAALQMDATLSLETADGALMETWPTVVSVGLPPDEEPGEPWTLSALILEFGSEAAHPWDGTLDVFVVGQPSNVEMQSQWLTLYVDAPGALGGSLYATFLELLGEGVGVWAFDIGTFEATREPPPGG